MPPTLSEALAVVTKTAAEGVYPNVTLVACDSLASSEPLAVREHARGRLHALSVEHTGGWLAVATFCFPNQVPQQTVELIDVK